MKCLYVLLIVVVLQVAAFCGERDFGAGIAVGLPTGITAKYWLGSSNTIDAAFGMASGDDVYFHVDYLWHDYHALPLPEEGKLPLYYGVGPVVKSSNHIGIRGVIGIEYLFADYPFDLFIELAPVLTMSPEGDFGFTGLLGGRYYWGN